MNRDNWMSICTSFKDLFEFVGNNHDELSSLSRFTINDVTELNQLIIAQKNHNGWFTEEIVRKALLGLSQMMNPIDLINWQNNYTFTENPKRVLLIMAGNIPLVGFHDLLCVWLSGNHAQIKLSSDDKTLLPAILDLVSEIHPEIKSYYTIESGKIEHSEAVIATGSDNSNLYFEKYFGHLPSLFRKNRTSIAVIQGNETKTDLLNLGLDIFLFFGKGCRNVSFMLISEDFNLNDFFEAILPYYEIVNHKKYGNNYDYNRAILLLNQETFLDNNFVIVKESDKLFSPISMIHFSRYKDNSEISEFIQKNEDNIQIILGKNYIPFGQGQYPKIWDYADGTDTMTWLNSLS
jgi:hypothetical protein